MAVVRKVDTIGRSYSRRTESGWYGLPRNAGDGVVLTNALLSAGIG
jgi:hypothetical protein